MLEFGRVFEMKSFVGFGVCMVRDDGGDYRLEWIIS